MRIFGKSALALMLAGAVAAPVAAQQGGISVSQENTGIGTAAAEFLLLGAGARGMALGSSYSAIVNNVESTYYNPAQVPLMDGPQAMLTLMSYFADTNYFWAGYAMPLANGEYGLGFNIQNFGFSGSPVYTEADPQGTEGLQYDVREMAVGVTFAHAFIDRFTGGVTAKYISDKLGQADATGFAFDVGTNFHTEWNGRPIALSFVIQNLSFSPLRHNGAGLQLKTFQTDTAGLPVTAVDPYTAAFLASEYSVPTAFRVGLAYDVVSSDVNRLTLLGQFSEASNINRPEFGGAAEWGWTPQNTPLQVMLRGGYDYQADNNVGGNENSDFSTADANAYDTEHGTGLDGLALGGGLAYQLGDYTAGIDYAWRNYGVLGSRNVFSISFGW